MSPPPSHGLSLRHGSAGQPRAVDLKRFAALTERAPVAFEEADLCLRAMTLAVDEAGVARVVAFGHDSGSAPLAVFRQPERSVPSLGAVDPRAPARVEAFALPADVAHQAYEVFFAPGVRRGHRPVRIAVQTLATLLCFGAAPAMAGVVAAPADTAATQAQELFHKGQTLYETSDYAGAVKYFTEAYGIAMSIEDKGRREKALRLLYWNLAQAHNRAYDLDGDRQHLTTAKDLLRKFSGESGEIKDGDVKALTTEIERKLGGQTDPEPAPAPTGDPEPLPDAIAEPDEMPAEPSGPAEEQPMEGPLAPATAPASDEGAIDAALLKKGKAFVGGGAALIAVGGLAVVGGIVIALPPFSYYSYATPWVIAGVGLAAVGGGIPLVIMGKKKIKQAKGDTARLMVTPVASRNAWGGQLRLSF